MQLKDYDTKDPISVTVVRSTRFTAEDSDTELRHIDVAVDTRQRATLVGEGRWAELIY